MATALPRINGGYKHGEKHSQSQRTFNVEVPVSYRIRPEISTKGNIWTIKGINGGTTKIIIIDDSINGYGYREFYYLQEVPMPYDVLESQIKSLPEAYYNELVDYLEFLLQKADKEKKSLEKVRESSLQTVWETIKDDTW